MEIRLSRLKERDGKQLIFAFISLYLYNYCSTRNIILQILIYRKEPRAAVCGDDQHVSEMHKSSFREFLR